MDNPPSSRLTSLAGDATSPPYPQATPLQSGYPAPGYPPPAGYGPGAIPVGYPFGDHAGTLHPGSLAIGGFPPGYNPWLGAVARPRYASAWRRLGAYLIDVIIFQLIWQVVQAILNGIVGTQLSPTDLSAAVTVTLASLILNFVLYGLYVAGQEGTWGQTLGKRALGIKVVKEDGTPIDVDAALVRYLFLFLAPLGFLGLVTLVMIATSEKKQRLGDKAAGTIVVRFP